MLKQLWPMIGPLPVASTLTGPDLSTPIPHWAISMWCAPQSVSIPPEYSSHHRNEPWHLSVTYSVIWVCPSHISQFRSVGQVTGLKGPPVGPVGSLTSTLFSLPILPFLTSS